MKNQKGITLIALIVTIIVLIILASVSINLLLGENGLITRAKNAKTVYTQSELEERVNLAYLDYKMQQETGKSTTLESILGEIEGVTVTALTADTTQDTFCIEKDGIKVTVNTQGDVAKGEIKVWKGIDDIKCPRIENETWYIDEPAQLNFLAYYVNNGCSTEGTKDLTSYIPSGTTVSMDASTMIELTNDLDMGARIVNGKVPKDVDTAYETANASVNWTPIAISQDVIKDESGNFTKLGTFDGKNHTIKNLYVNSTDSAGIFGNSSTIQNLTIKNSYIKGGSMTGGIVGTNRGATSKIEKCYNVNTIVILRQGDYQAVGGIVGQVVKDSLGIKDCNNSGIVVAYGHNSSGVSRIGGIVGSLRSK